MIDRTEPPAIVNLREYENGTVRANAGFSVASSSREKTIELAWFHYLAFCAPALDQRTAEIVEWLQGYGPEFEEIMKTAWPAMCEGWNLKNAGREAMEHLAAAIQKRYPQTGTRHE